jgi:L-serine dehydratase
MESVSVFDMLKIGVGPSSSHTLGPWRAAQKFINSISNITSINSIEIKLYGSLALTGKGHGTDIAVLLGLSGYDPVTIDVKKVKTIPLNIKSSKKISLKKNHSIDFNLDRDIVFHSDIFLDEHPNGITLIARDESSNLICDKTYFSVGGGFITENNSDKELTNKTQKTLTYPIHNAKDLTNHCIKSNKNISSIVLANEKCWKDEEKINQELLNLWDVMLESIYIGCHSKGVLPGGLNVKRRAADIYEKLSNKNWNYHNKEEWLSIIKNQNLDFSKILKWISCFSLAVNEQNADFGRIVTAPTNGASGVIPAVLMYYLCFSKKEEFKAEKDIIDFLLVAGEIGSIFKKGATISAAMGGCQAEIGVSSAMAAAGLAQLIGCCHKQSLIAAEIAMEHHLGLTCDPIGGLVQIPCIERNSMGAIKAIMAANLAFETEPNSAKITLDNVVETMLETAKDMSHKYKETSTGGLATKITVNIPEC